MSSRFRVALLGGFEIQNPSGASLKLATRKAQGLLAYLASRTGVEFERDKLAGLLWGDRDDERARNSLRQTLFQLRRVTEPASPQLLNITAHTVAMNPAAVEVDVGAFERAARSGAPPDLEDAATLYRGDLLDGFTVDETPFEEWLLQERERLRELAMDGLNRLLQWHRAQGKPESAVRTCRRLLALEPWQEPVHRVLMRLLVQSGQPGAALHHYLHCEEVLKRELGVEPEAETRALYEGIRKRYNVSDGIPEPALDELEPASVPPTPGAVVFPDVRSGRATMAELQVTLSRQIVKLSQQYVHAVGSFLQQRQARSELLSAQRGALQVRRFSDRFPPRPE